MKETITRWLDWLKKATARDDERLGHVYSDGEQLWATNGYVLHALDVATGRRVGSLPAKMAGCKLRQKALSPHLPGRFPKGTPPLPSWSAPKACAARPKARKALSA
jgi:hypothetical protein